MNTRDQRLSQLLDSHFDRLASLDFLRLKSGAFMDLTVDVLFSEDDGKRVRIAMAHRYKQNGDLVPDPDMEMELDSGEVKMASPGYRCSQAVLVSGGSGESGAMGVRQ